MRPLSKNMMPFEKFFDREDLNFHLDWLKEFERVLILQDSVLAAVLLGSFAGGSPDRLSDLDIIVWVKSPRLELATKRFSSIDLYETVHCWEKQYSESHFFSKKIYSNFVSSEVHILTCENDFKIRDPFVVLKDTSSFLDSKWESGRPPEHKDFEPLTGGQDGLGWELFNLFKWWQRGDHELVKRHIERISNKFRSDLNEDSEFL